MADEKENQDPKVDEGGEPGAETPKTNDDLLELLVGFIENIIPDTKEIIAGILESDGEERIEKIGMLKGCMQAMGLPMTEETYGKMLDDRLAEFSKALDDKLSGVQNSIAQFSRPDGLKGRAGADKQTSDKPQSLVMFGRGVPRY